MTRLASIAALVLFFAYGGASHFWPEHLLYAALPLAGSCTFAAMAAAGARWWLPAAVGVAAIAALIKFDPVWVVYIPPVLLNGMAGMYFFRSLYTGRLSVIERIITLVHGAEQPRFRRYARTLTFLWGALLTGIAFTALILGFFGPHYWWSLFANLLAFLIMAAFAIVEYIVRRLRFPDHQTAGPLRIAQIVKERGLAALAARDPR